MPDIIYVDVLIIVNFLVNYFLILAVGTICSLNIDRRRIVFGGLLGAISSLSIFIDGGIFLPLAVRLVLPFLMILISYKFRSLKNYIINTMVLFLASFIFSGLMLGIILVYSPPNINFLNGTLYFDINPVLLFALTVICYILIGVYKRFFHSKTPDKQIYRVLIRRNDKTVVLEGFIDTGNKLREPFTAYPVAVGGLRQLKPLFTEEEYEMLLSDKNIMDYPGKFKLIPYNSVGKSGLLPGFVPDEFTLSHGENVYKVDEIAVAISDDQYICGEFNIILPAGIVFEKDKNFV